MRYVVGIDTSNYTTSVALVSEEGEVVKDLRKILSVKEGQRGLRQQEALFQHVQNLPGLWEEAVADISAADILAVGVSDKPRRVEGSYMPCFTAGTEAASMIRSLCKVPEYRFSHQEGHLAAALYSLGQPVCFEGELWAFHLSGGTCELLEVKPHMESSAMTCYDSTLIGATKDISFGQVLDRVGVALGMRFPAGAEMDRIAVNNTPSKVLTPVKVEGRDIHLSGLESQIQREIEKAGADDKEALISEVFEKITDAIKKMTKGSVTTVLMGGVSESQYIRNALAGDERYRFSGSYGRDNAVGIALLALERVKHEADPGIPTE